MGVSPRQVRSGRGREPFGEVLVGPVRGGDQVVEGGVAGEQLPGARVQGRLGMRTGVVVHGGTHEGVWEADGPAAGTIGGDQDGRRAAQVLQRLLWMLDVGDAGHEVDHRSFGQQGCGPGQSLGVLGVGGQGAGHQQGVRRRRRQRVRGEERFSRELVEQRPKVQRAPVGVIAQPSGSRPSAVPGSETLRLDELDDLCLAQAVDAQSVPVGVGQPEQPRWEPRHLVVAGHEDREHRVRGQPPESEGQRT